MQNDENMIEVTDLHKSFGTLEVLKGIDLAVRKGTVFALIGTNGAGKTTLIRILCTLLRPDSGTASVNGADVLHDSDCVRRSISLTGQFAAVDEVLTGRENLELMGRLWHQDNPAQIAEQLLERFGLTDAADRRVSGYSGGMRRRTDIAMSLVGNPKVLFLDEPTTGLDPESRQEVWKTIRGLAEGGCTVFLTTQYLEEAQELADRIAILHEGRILVEGTLSELRSLLPPAKKVWSLQQPSLEEIYFALIQKKGA